MLLKACLLTLGLFSLTVPVMAHDYRVGDLVIEHPWSRPTPPGTPVGVGYMTIHNHGDNPVRLVAAESPVAERVSIHETTTANGLMKMQALPDGLDVPAGGETVLKPHSYHLMLESLQSPLKPGQQVPLILVFDGYEPLEVMLHVEQPDGRPPEEDHSAH